MNDPELRFHLEKIEDKLNDISKDKFLTNLYDGVLIGVTAGLIQGIILKLLGI